MKEQTKAFFNVGPLICRVDHPSPGNRSTQLQWSCHRRVFHCSSSYEKLLSWKSNLLHFLIVVAVELVAGEVNMVSTVACFFWLSCFQGAGWGFFQCPETLIWSRRNSREDEQLQHSSVARLHSCADLILRRSLGENIIIWSENLRIS